MVHAADSRSLALFDFASFTENDIQVWTITKSFAFHAQNYLSVNDGFSAALHSM